MPRKEWDKEEQRKYNRDWYAKNSTRIISSRGKRRKQKREEYKAFKENLVCLLCAETDPICLDFHHIDPTKKESTISYAFHSYSKKRLEEEISKCVVLCSNCHRRVHAGSVSLPP